MQLIQVDNGELLHRLTSQLAALGITDAAIVSLVGGVDSFSLSTMPTGDPSSDVVTEYAIPGELTGAGEVVAGAVHIHATLGVEGGAALAGHLNTAQVDTWFVRAYVEPITR